MQLGILVAVVAALVASQNAPAETVREAPLRAGLALVSGLAVVLLATFSSRTVAQAIRQDASRRLTWLRMFAGMKQIHLAVWLLMGVFILFVLNWPQVVRHNWALDQFVLVRDLLVLAPMCVTLLGSWAAFYEVERADYASSHRGVLEEVWTASPPLISRGAFVWMHARHYLGLTVLPVLALLAVQDTVSCLMPGWQDTAGAWLVYLVPLAAITIAFPFLLSRIWKTSQLPDSPLRARLVALTQRMGIGCRDFRIWQTDGQYLNAAVAGLLPAARYVFVTDGLLRYLRDDEMEAVIAHELGHVRRHHLWLRLALLGLPLWLVAHVQAWSPPPVETPAVWRAALAASLPVAPHVAVAGLTSAAAIVALGRYSRLLEHDADLCVWEAGQGATFLATMDRISYLSHDRRQRATWLHPSTASRVHLLQRALHDPQAAWAFRQRVRVANALLLAAWLLAPWCTRLP